MIRDRYVRNTSSGSLPPATRWPVSGHRLKYRGSVASIMRSISSRFSFTLPVQRGYLSRMPDSVLSQLNALLVLQAFAELVDQTRQRLKILGWVAARLSLASREIEDRNAHVMHELADLHAFGHTLVEPRRIVHGQAVIERGHLHP